MKHQPDMGILRRIMTYNLVLSLSICLWSVAWIRSGNRAGIQAGTTVGLLIFIVSMIVFVLCACSSGSLRNWPAEPYPSGRGHFQVAIELHFWEQCTAAEGPVKSRLRRARAVRERVGRASA